MFKTKIDNINMFKLEKYFQRSEIVKKVYLQVIIYEIIVTVYV